MNSQPIEIAVDDNNNQYSGLPQTDRFPIRFREDRSTGIFWPEFWIGGMQSVNFSRPRFILVPLTQVAGPHQPPNVLSLSTEVFTGSILEVIQEEDQDRMVAAAFNSPFNLVNATGVLNDFMARVNIIWNATHDHGYFGQPRAGNFGLDGVPLGRPPLPRVTTFFSVDRNYDLIAETLTLRVFIQNTVVSGEVFLPMIPVFI